MSEDEIQGPFARKQPQPDTIFDSLAENIVTQTPSALPAPPPSHPAYENREVILKGGLLEHPIFVPQPAAFTTNIADLEAIVVYDETPEAKETETKTPAEPMPPHPPIILNINDAQVDADVASFYRLSDYETRRGIRKYAAAAAVLIAGTLAGSTIGITYHPTQASDTAPVMTKTNVSTGTTAPENGLETTTEQHGERCSICGRENCARLRNHQQNNEQNSEERTEDTTTTAPNNNGVRTTHSQSLASFIGNYQFQTNWNGRRRTYTLDGTTTEKAQAYNLLTRIAYEDRIANPQAKMTYLESSIFERVDPDGNTHVTLSDVQRVANQYENLRQN